MSQPILAVVTRSPSGDYDVEPFPTDETELVAEAVAAYEETADERGNLPDMQRARAILRRCRAVLVRP